MSRGGYRRVGKGAGAGEETYDNISDSECFSVNSRNEVDCKVVHKEDSREVKMEDNF